MLYYCGDGRENIPKSKKKGKIMDNHKSALLETIEHMSKFAGSLTGRVVVCSKEFADCVKNIATAKLEPKPEPYSKTAEATKSQAKKEIAESEKKKATSEQEKMKKKTEKSKPSGGSQSYPKTKAGEKTKIIAISKKRRTTVTKKKKSNTKTSGPTAKK